MPHMTEMTGSVDLLQSELQQVKVKGLTSYGALTWRRTETLKPLSRSIDYIKNNGGQIEPVKISGVFSEFLSFGWDHN